MRKAISELTNTELAVRLIQRRTDCEHWKEKNLPQLLVQNSEGQAALIEAEWQKRFPVATPESRMLLAEGRIQFIENVFFQQLRDRARVDWHQALIDKIEETVVPHLQARVRGEIENSLAGELDSKEFITFALGYLKVTQDEAITAMAGALERASKIDEDKFILKLLESILNDQDILEG